MKVWGLRVKAWGVGFGVEEGGFRGPGKPEPKKIANSPAAISLASGLHEIGSPTEDIWGPVQLPADIDP